MVILQKYGSSYEKYRRNGKYRHSDQPVVFIEMNLSRVLKYSTF